MSSVERQRKMSRVERAARTRRHRARAHLERVRRRSSEPERAHIQPSRRRGAALVLLLSLGAGVLAGAVWRSGASLDGLAVLGLERVSPAEIASQSGLEPGTPLSQLDPGALARRLEEHGWIETARALALPSGRVLVAVAEREPVAVLVGESSWAVDASGLAFARLGEADASGLPRITAAQPPQPGQPNPELAQAVALFRELSELGLPAAEEIGVSAASNPEGFWLRLPGLAPRIVLGRHDLAARLAHLAQLLDAAPPALSGAERVDLRFRNQAVLDVTPPQGAEQAAATHGAAASSTTRPAG